MIFREMAVDPGLVILSLARVVDVHLRSSRKLCLVSVCELGYFNRLYSERNLC